MSGDVCVQPGFLLRKEEEIPNELASQSSSLLTLGWLANHLALQSLVDAVVTFLGCPLFPQGLLCDSAIRH